ncbi:MAG: hypothetical protein ACFB6S_04520 [Geminicoccaceae bacterium]
MLSGHRACREYLKTALPREWQLAHDQALGIVRRIEFLPWAGRAGAIDAFLWDRAQFGLDQADVTAVINRQLDQVQISEAILRFGCYCRHTVAATMMILEETTPITCADQALVMSVSGRQADRQAADAWITNSGFDVIAEQLHLRPGHAFFLLATTPADSRQSFVARDAFWQSMLGQLPAA